MTWRLKTNVTLNSKLYLMLIRYKALKWMGFYVALLDGFMQSV